MFWIVGEINRSYLTIGDASLTFCMLSVFRKKCICMLFHLLMFKCCRMLKSTIKEDQKRFITPNQYGDFWWPVDASTSSNSILTYGTWNNPCPTQEFHTKSFPTIGYCRELFFLCYLKHHYISMLLFILLVTNCIYVILLESLVTHFSKNAICTIHDPVWTAALGIDTNCDPG